MSQYNKCVICGSPIEDERNICDTCLEKEEEIKAALAKEEISQRIEDYFSDENDSSSVEN